MGRSTRTPSTAGRKGSRHVTAGLLGLVALMASACTAGALPTTAPSVAATSTGSASAPSAPSAPPTQSTTPEPSPTAAAAFPVTITDDEGTEVELGLEPERVISLSPANTEILFTIGAGDKVVGGTAFDDFPPQAAALPDVATYTGVLIEQVVDLEPDLVIAAGNGFTPPADIDRMRQLGLEVMVVYAEDVDEVLADIELIGTAVGASDEARAVTDSMRGRLADVTAAVDGLPERPRVFYQLGSEPEIFGPAPDSFVADMVELAGGAPITTGDPAVFSISVEKLVSDDPEVIIVGDAAYGVCPGDVKSRPGWRRMTAVRDDAVRPIDDLIVTRPGPRLAEGLAALAVAIHPDLQLDPAPAPVTLCGP